MRGGIELLKILLNNIDRLETGLCKLIDDLTFIDSILDYKERTRILMIIQLNRPRDSGSYYYKKGDISPRKRYLKRLIKKYETI